MAEILTRKQMHELLDAVLDIVDRRDGTKEYPYVGFEFDNYTHSVSLEIKEHGFIAGTPFDLFESIHNDNPEDEKEKRLRSWMEYLDKLKSEHPCEAATSGRSENNT